MNSVQVFWVCIGIGMGMLMLIPIRRCLSTHNGFASMLMASIMGIFNVGSPWIAIICASVCFAYGLYQHQQKHFTPNTGETQHEQIK